MDNPSSIEKARPDAKKKSKLAAEAKAQERAEFKKKQKTLDSERLVFLDECSINLAMTRTYARALKGKRARVIEPFNRGSNISCIGALSLDGYQAPMMIEGAIDTQVFDLYVEKFLVPTLIRGDIVILDNVKFHHSQKAAELIRAAGAELLHLPTYSPDFNPIEECFSKIKECLRSSKARTIRKLYNAMKKAIDKVSIDDIYGWFTHCGYS